MDRFRDRNAVVTGASRGIGAAIAERLCAEGANVAIVARTVDAHGHLPGSLNETAQRCGRYGTKVVTIAADLADDESRAAIIPAALGAFDGQIDLLVNNAAAAIYGPASELPLKRRRIMLEVNTLAPIDLIQAVAPSMIERGEGWIVNLSSASIRHVQGPPFDAAGRSSIIGSYGASKAALNRMTNAIAVELYPHGIRVNTVEPRAAVMSEGAEALVGGTVSDDLIESMEAMVEGVLVLLDCDRDLTGRIGVSLDLLDEFGVAVMTLDGTAPYPGGQRVYRS